jgi:excisionase family DNA binding protein
VRNQIEAGTLEKANVLTVHDVAAYLRMSEAKVYRMARSGSVPAFRLGKSWRFRKDSIDEWMLRQIGLATQLAIPAGEY